MLRRTVFLSFVYGVIGAVSSTLSYAASTVKKNVIGAGLAANEDGFHVKPAFAIGAIAVVNSKVLVYMRTPQNPELAEWVEFSSIEGAKEAMEKDMEQGPYLD